MIDELVETSLDQPKFALEHGLGAYFYKEYDCALFKKNYTKNLQFNMLLLDQWRDLQIRFAQANISVWPLKGVYLINEIYGDPGLRTMSDIDLLFNSDSKQMVQQSLEQQGFELQEEEQWYGNQHKLVFYKDCGYYSITLEAHFALFWHLPGDRPVQTPTDHLLFLMGHLAFQHNFIKIFWLLDIYKYASKYAEQINWPKFFIRAKELGLYNSAVACIYAVRQLLDPEFLFGLSVKTPLWCRLLISPSFLKYPRQHPLRYFLLKFLLKDDKGHSLKYLWHWLQHKLKSHFAPIYRHLPG